MQCEDVPAFLEDRRTEIVRLMERVAVEKERDDESHLFYLCLGKAGELVDMFSKGWGIHFAIICAATRGMLELSLLVRLFEDKPDYRTKFLHSVIWDEKELWQAFLDLGQESSALDSLRQYVGRLDAIETQAGLSRQQDYIGRINWSDLAKRFRLHEEDYKTIYKWSSKMLHITPFSVIRAPRMPLLADEERAAWNTMLLKIQVYLEETCQMLAKLLDIETSE